MTDLGRLYQRIRRMLLFLLLHCIGLSFGKHKRGIAFRISFDVEGIILLDLLGGLK